MKNRFFNSFDELLLVPGDLIEINDRFYMYVNVRKNVGYTIHIILNLKTNELDAFMGKDRVAYIVRKYSNATS